MAAPHMLAQDIFSYLRPEQIEAIHKASTVIERRVGDVIYKQGEKGLCLYVLLEGKVSLRLPGKKGFSMGIDTLERGAIFGAGASFEPGAYTVTAQCLSDCKILRINTDAWKRLMDEDARLGYALQKRISDVYFKRYLDAMQRLQAIMASIE